ncbi:hypothetical protein FTO74_12695 [Granulicella sp. WH15]|uniref:TonB-dependent receptor n=1 Tax=Granulicella sp. WH15 TaxID=2602070 RepID=UPI0013674936|nr:TonB-dependent receptor [Granulicella sp. WH15]QHN04130.1 hypothetical protein FTO74_12695 [Granulicella sp. WH15]
MLKLKHLYPVFLLAGLTQAAYAQTVDTSISGTIVDAGGAAIPGATVTIASPTTGQTKSFTSGNSGEYSITYLIPGSYDISVVAPGFATYQTKGITLEINQQAKINVSMKAGGGNEVVEVHTTQPLLTTDNGTLGAVVGTTEAANLPLNGRKFNDLAVLTPGVTVTNPDNHSSSTDGSTVSSNGNQNTWGQVFLDGVTMVNNRSPYVNAYPSVDAVQEFSVLTSNYGAQYGGGAGAIVNVQLKSGTNQFHGTVFEFIRNSAVDARDYFRPAPLAKTVLKQNQFGGVVTGPIVKDKTFFMFSYEGIRSIQQSAETTTVFTDAELNGDFSAVPQSYLRNPFTGDAYANKQIPVNSVALNIARNYMPRPNIPGTSNGTVNNYSGVQTGNQVNNQYLTRVDHKINDKNQLAIHYLYQGRDFPLTSYNPVFSYTGTYKIHNTGLQYVHIFSPTLINEVRGGADLEHVQQLPAGYYNSDFTAAQLGINQFTLNGVPLPPTQEGFPTITISNFVTVGSGTAASNLDDSRTYQLTDNLTWTKGRHTILMGGDLRHVQDNATTNNTPFGSLSFTGALTAGPQFTSGGTQLAASAGNAGADFLLGLPASVITPEGVPLTAARQWRYGFYVQDDWKPTPKLTVNIGLRYDLWMPPHNNLNTSRTLDFSTATPTLVPLPNPLWKITHKDFSPRVGFAYSFPRNMVFRGAYGITFYGGKFDNINILQLNPPIDSSFSISNTTGPTVTAPTTPAPQATINNPVPASIAPASANVATLPADDRRPDLYLQTYTATLSKQFWNNVLDISYVGVKGTHQDTSIPYFNSGPPNDGTKITVQANRPYPTYGRIRYVDFHGASQYHGLQAKFQHKYSHGLTLTTSYTYSHLLDNQGGDTNGSRSETQIPTSKEWASGLTDQRHYLSIGFVYETKFDMQSRMSKALANGWMLTSLYSYVTGTPLFITQSQDLEHNDNLFQRPDFAPGNDVNTLELPASQRTLNRWFNTAAFQNANGHYGNVPRNPNGLRTPSHYPLTLGLSRSFPMPYNDRHSLLVRLEAFNALNTPQFSSPGTEFGSSSFGVISSTASGYSNRALQLAAKYSF